MKRRDLSRYAAEQRRFIDRSSGDDLVHVNVVLAHG
jgi:hypothetical protein